MRLVLAMTDMRPVATYSAITLLVAVAAVTPLRAQGTEPPACVSATGPDVSPGTPDSAAVRSGAMQRADSMRTGAGSARPTTNPTVRLVASVQADEVRFARQPKICVRLRGDAQLDSVHVVARRNIQSPVAAGTTYRDVYVAVEILGHLNAQCIAARITGQQASGACASLELRDSASSGRAPPAQQEGSP